MIGVCIVTYNEERYIAECIDSALSQVCNEKIRVYVADDCSTDKTAQICNSYGERIVFVERNSNLGLLRNTLLLLNQIRNDGCDYVAMLDGDDYWKDKQKLQKQIDYFNCHPNCGLIHTCVDLLYANRLVCDNRISAPTGNVWNTIDINYRIINCSVMFKTKLLELINFEEFSNQGFWSVDYVMYCIFASKTEFGFLADHTAVWRRDHGSVSDSKNMEKQINYVENYICQMRYLHYLFPERFEFSEEMASSYRHLFAFNTAFKFCDRKRAVKESKLMSPNDRKKMRFKIVVAHFSWLMYLWRYIKLK